MSHIKQAIRDELEATGMTQADLAAFMGASEKHVSQVLTGNVAGTFGFLAKMAAACGLTITATRQLDHWRLAAARSERPGEAA